MTAGGLRGLRRAVGIGVLVLVEAALLGYWAASGSTLAFLGAQTVVVLALGLVALVTRYRAIARDLHLQTVRTAAARERALIAERMHDTLGHQLSVIALRASALQVRSTGQLRDVATAVQHDADDAVDMLHEIIDVLRIDDDGPAALASVEGLVRQVEAAGAHVVHSGVDDTLYDDVTRRYLYGVVREGLTNAARHAPGRTVTVDISTLADGRVVVTISNPLATPSAEGTRRPETAGLTLLSGRVRSVGGTTSVDASGHEFVLTATLPPHPSERAGNAAGRRSALRVLLGQAALPSIAAVLLLVAFHTWASHGSVMETSAFGVVAVGAPEDVVAPTTPRREAPVRLLPTAPHDASWRCDYFTDGNVPLALATFEICYLDGAVVRVTDLREQPWT